MKAEQMEMSWAVLMVEKMELMLVKQLVDQLAGWKVMP